MIRIGCYILGALLLGGAGAYLIWGRDKGVGIFAVLFAVVFCRILVLNIAGQIEDEEAKGDVQS